MSPPAAGARPGPLPRLATRPRDSHKGTFGRVLLVAGSPAMAGAAILAARGALRAGCGLATVAIEASAAATVTPAVPEATLLLLPRRDDPDFAVLAARTLGDPTDRFDAVAIGPGLGTDAAARALVEIVLASEGPQVVDADAISLVARGTPAPPNPRRVWTPHPGEFRRLERSSPSGDTERVAAAGECARRRGGVLVLKGHRTVIHDGERAEINLSGNPGMATGGAGDVLTGVIAALLAQGLPPFDSARLGVYLHGLAGDLAARRLGEVSLTAGDIVESLPEAFRRLDEGGRGP